MSQALMDTLHIQDLFVQTMFLYVKLEIWSLCNEDWFV